MSETRTERGHLQSDGRVYLRRPTRDDRDEYLALRRDSADFHRPWDPLPPPGVDPYSHASFERYLAGAESDRRSCMLLHRHEDDAIVGAINFNEIVRGVLQTAFLGYWMGVAYARHGYMTAGLRLAIDHAFGPFGLHRVEANVRPENEPSIALVKRLGFRLEGYSPRYVKIAGEWSDHERWALLADEWPTAADATRDAAR